MCPEKILLLLGSNLGDKQKNLVRCLNLFSNYSISIIKVSSIYLTPPEGVPLPHPDYLNMAVVGETALLPRELLLVTQEVEKKMGRNTKKDLAPRVIDVDILLYDELELKTPILELPHPQIFTRQFVIHIIKEIGFSYFPSFERILKDTLKHKKKPAGMKLVVKSDHIVLGRDGWRIVNVGR